MKKKIVIVLVAVIVLFAGMASKALTREKEPKITGDEILDRVESVLGDEYKKQTVSEVIAKLTYSHKNGGSPIYYYFVKTTYYDADPAEVTGLNIDAFRTLFNPQDAITTEEMMIQAWYGCRYVFADMSYLCWTAAPDISYVIEYNPSTISDADIIRMAQSAAPINPTE